MGVFWDLMQQDQIEEQKRQADTLEERVAHMEEELGKTRALLRKTLEALEVHLGEDIDGDGRTGH